MMVFSVFTANVHANTGLKSAFEELNYALTVELDPKAPNAKDVYVAELTKFNAKLRELQSKGLTNSQLLDFVRSEVKNEKVARDLDTAFSMISINKMTASEASNYMVETMKKSYNVGASWNGDAVLYIGLGVLLIAVGVAAALGGGGSSGGGGGYCSEYRVCDTTCYDDYWYGYTCYDDCYYTCY